jgi:pimeloyl-ACP methyl ester carboxylesterase/sporulation protein YlmC with PRC-barrel domain
MKAITILALLCAGALTSVQAAVAQQEGRSQLNGGQYVEVNDARIYYEVTGDGQPLVLIHGYPLSGKLFREQQKDLSDSFMVVTLDLRGFGRSETADSDATLETYADDVLEVMNELGIDTALIGGHSMGGMTALQMYKQEPDRFDGLLLIDTAAIASPIAYQGLWHGFADQAEEKGVKSMAELLVPQMLSGDTRLNNKQLVNDLNAIVGEASVDAAVAGGNALAERSSYESLLGTIDVPTLIIVGVEDTVTPVEISQKMAQAIPNAKLSLIEGAAHAPSIEHPEQFNQAVREWSRQVMASSGQASGPASAETRSAASAGAAAMTNMELSGKTVVSTDGDVIGEVSEVAWSDQHGEEVARISLDDGFLGVGQREIEIPVSQLETVDDGQIGTSMTRDDIEAMLEESETQPKMQE